MIWMGSALSFCPGCAEAILKSLTVASELQQKKPRSPSQFDTCSPSTLSLVLSNPGMLGQSGGQSYFGQTPVTRVDSNICIGLTTPKYDEDVNYERCLFGPLTNQRPIIVTYSSACTIC